jgi:small subunit ribosomal protein S2
MESTSERVGIRELLEAGVHFGHQAKRWNPKMKRYIFAERAGVHIIDLDQTLTLLDGALNFVRSVAEADREAGPDPDRRAGAEERSALHR